MAARTRLREALPLRGRPCAVWLALALGAAAVACTRADAADLQELSVTATAYNSVPGQTNARPRLTAWGDRLSPGMKAIAVSRDLLELGLSHGMKVEIVGLPGIYVVRDKMAKRWRRKIDIYMGEDVRGAREWGKRSVTIRWRKAD